MVTLALVLILFDGGLHIGWSRFRAAAAPIVTVGVAGTFLTAAGGAVLLHVVFGLDWYLALLVATAVAPTDPAVVFSVLGQREITGRPGTILEGRERRGVAGRLVDHVREWVSVCPGVETTRTRSEPARSSSPSLTGCRSNATWSWAHTAWLAPLRRASHSPRSRSRCGCGSPGRARTSR